MDESSIAHLFGVESRRQQYLTVEATLAAAQAEAGLVPPSAAERIASVARLEKLDTANIDRTERRTGHLMVALIDELARVAGEPHGGYVHWGATTQNIQQTGEVLLIREAYEAIRGLVRQVLTALGDLGFRTAELPMPGRTHGQHAVPITFGLKVASWSDAFIRHLDRLDQCGPRVLVCMMAGAAGTFGAMGPRGRAVQAGVAARLGLREMPVPARNVVDQFVELVTVHAMIAATAGTIADEVARLMATEFGEVSEPVPDGDVGSSTMPQKRNPKVCMAIATTAAQVRALVPLSLEASLQAHEVDGGRSELMQRTVRDSCVMTYDVLFQLLHLVSGLDTFPGRMRENLELSHGTINAEVVMMRLAERMGRQKAHKMVHALATEASLGGAGFLAALIKDPAVLEHFEPAEVTRWVDPTSYVGESVTLAREAAERARARAASA